MRDVRDVGAPWSHEAVEVHTREGVWRASLHVARGEVELVVSAWPGMRCQPWSEVTARLRLVHPVEITLDDRPHWWSFEPPMDQADVLAELVRTSVGRQRWPPMDARHLHACTLLDRLVAHATDLALEVTDEGAVAIVRELAPRTRAFAYAGLLADERGRFAEALAAWPGLIALAASHPSSALIARLIHEGRSIRDIVDGTLGELRDRPGARRLVRDAPPRLDGAALRGVIEAPGIDVNDVPAAPAARPYWYRWASAWRVVIEDRPQGSPIRVGGFVSRHALALEALARAVDATAETLVAELLDMLDRTATPPPGRSSSPARVLERLRAWHETLWDLRLGRDAVLRVGPPGPAAPSPLVVTPLATAAELVAEGRAMRHCVAAYAADGVAGQLCFYQVTLDDERLTVAISDRGGRWRLVEASGPRNRAPSPRACRKLETWLDCLNQGASSTW